MRRTGGSALPEKSPQGETHEEMIPGPRHLTRSYSQPIEQKLHHKKFRDLIGYYETLGTGLTCVVAGFSLLTS